MCTTDHDAAHTHYRGLLGRLEDERAAERSTLRELRVMELDEEIARLQEEDRVRR